MKKYKYLIVGSGMTGDAAVRGIRELDPNGSIGMIGNETDMPYARPPLSKGLWKGRPFEKVWLGTDKLNIEIHLGRQAAELNLASKGLRDDQGDEYTYDKLLLATGGSPIHLRLGNEEIIYYRNLQDYQRLHALAEQGQKFLVIGSGFIGSEIAAALSTFGKQVTMVFRDNSIGGNIYPSELSDFLSDFYRRKNVELIPSDEVISLAKNGSCFDIQTRGGREVQVDAIVAGLGVSPERRAGKIRGFKNREWHHRGQLSAYVRRGCFRGRRRGNVSG